MITSIALSIFGMILADRIWIVLKHSCLLYFKNRVNMFRMFCPIISVTLFLTFRNSFGHQLFVSILFCFIPLLTACLDHLIQSKKRMSAILRGLDLVILRMRAGSSLRTALRAVSRQTSPAQEYFLQLIDLVEFKKPPCFQSPVENQVARVLIDADSSQIRSIDKLKALRDQLKREEQFRQRSGQLSFQSKTQAFVMVGLFILAIAFGVHHFGWSSMRFWILSTLGPFLCGIIWILNIGRGWHWKV
jgi:Flp pilus assembly protein TadB